MSTVKCLSDSLPLSTGTGSQCLRQVCVCSEQYKVSGVLHCSQAHVARAVFPLQTAEENLTVSLQKPLSSELSDFNLYVSQKVLFKGTRDKNCPKKEVQLSLAVNSSVDTIY